MKKKNQNNKIKKEYLVIEISKLKPWKKNPKRHDLNLLRKSIKEFGYIENIVIDEKNRVIAGHGRLKILKELGIKKIDVLRISGLTEKQKEKYALLSNKIVEKGGWDFLKLENFDIDFLFEIGFEEKELKNFSSLKSIQIFEDIQNLQKTFSIIIKCTSAEQQKEVMQLLNIPKPHIKYKDFIFHFKSKYTLKTKFSLEKFVKDREAK